jgi:V/A-type H+-transporting ATPase subunit E
MSLGAILEAIHVSGEQKIQEMETRAAQQADEILAAARREAERTREAACTKEVMPAYKERARIIHRARLEGLRICGDTREALVDAALERARERLMVLREGPVYPEVFKKLMQEALAGLKESAEDVTLTRLEVDRRDRELLQSARRYTAPDILVDFELKCWGGLIARSEDGRLVVINTLESRLERAEPYLRRSLAALFEQTQAAEVAFG